jgi:hypothetical protein
MAMFKARKLTDDEFDEYMDFAQRQNWKPKPTDVIQLAKNPSSILHGVFEWDVEKAAHQHLLNTAESLFHRNKQYFRKAKKKPNLVFKEPGE